MKTIELKSDVSWNKVNRLFNGNVIEYNIEDSEIEQCLLVVCDDFGEDHVSLLKDGRICFSDRNSGLHYITKISVGNVTEFVSKLENLLK